MYCMPMFPNFWRTLNSILVIELIAIETFHLKRYLRIEEKHVKHVTWKCFKITLCYVSRLFRPPPRPRLCVCCNSDPHSVILPQSLADGSLLPVNLLHDTMGFLLNSAYIIIHLSCCSLMNVCFPH
jgi:hypothetical protein